MSFLCHSSTHTINNDFHVQKENSGVGDFLRSCLLWERLIRKKVKGKILWSGKLSLSSWHGAKSERNKLVAGLKLLLKCNHGELYLGWKLMSVKTEIAVGNNCRGNFMNDSKQIVLVGGCGEFPCFWELLLKLLYCDLIEFLKLHDFFSHQIETNLIN